MKKPPIIKDGSLESLVWRLRCSHTAIDAEAADKLLEQARRIVQLENTVEEQEMELSL